MMAGKLRSTRGSGRTARQLAALPDGSVYVVCHEQEVAHCKHLLRHILGRPSDCLRLVSLGEGEARYQHLRGLGPATVYDVNHWVPDHALPHQLALLRPYVERLTPAP